MRFAHVVITRFCCRTVGFERALRAARVERGNRRWRLTPPRRRETYDPLRPDTVEHRLRLLEIAPLPSLVAQTDQDFDWVVLIDRDLEPEFRARLDRLLRERDRTHLHVVDARHGSRGTEWLEPYHPGLATGDYLVTTNLDDDDALPRDYLEELRRTTRRFASDGRPLLVLGATRTNSWDLVLRRRTPFGTVAPWHRPSRSPARVSSCGFSLAARQPDYPFTVCGMHHRHAGDLLDFSTSTRHPAIDAIREEFLAAAAIVGDDLAGFPPAATVHDLSRAIGPVTMTNHRLNLQQTRLFESKPGRRAVSGPETFPTTQLGWEALARHGTHFRSTPRLRLRQVRWRVATQAARARRRIRRPRRSRRSSPTPG